MNQVVKAGLVLLVPGMLLAWLIKTAAESRDPYDEEFVRYVKNDFDRMKAEEQRWIH